MASGGEVIPPTGGGCVCASARPAMTSDVSTPKKAAGSCNLPMVQCPSPIISRRFFMAAGGCASEECCADSSHRDVVDQAGVSDFRRDQDPHRPVIERGNRRQRLGVPDLEIIQREAGAGNQFRAGGDGG